MDLYKILDELNIEYIEIEHEPVFTIEQAKNIKNRMSGIGCKNLFLTDRKGKYFLVILEENKKANIKELSKLLQVSHLSFANIEDLKNILNLEQGSVTPLGIINDEKNMVTVVIDKELQGKRLLVHPNTNKKTLSINYNDLIKFIEFEKHKYLIVWKGSKKTNERF